MESKSRIIVPVLLIFVFTGIIMSYFGIKEINKNNEISKNYVSVEGKFVESNIYSSNSKGITYTLTYSYFANGKEYKISTNGGVSGVPEIGTAKTIKYNPSNPNMAIITGIGLNGSLLFVGLSFIFISLIGFTTYILNKGKVLNALANVFVGLILMFLGFGCYLIMCSGGDSLSIIYAFKTYRLWVFVPILFVIGGICTVYASIFNPELLKSKDLLTMITSMFKIMR